MGDSGNCVIYLLIAFIISPAILQGIGVFGTEWIDGKNCTEVDYKPTCCDSSNKNLNNKSSCKGPFKIRDLHDGVYTIQWISFGILLSPIIFALLDAFCADDEDKGACTLIGGFCFLFYPVAGLLSFVGCMIIAAKYSGQSFGTSFNMCLAAGLYVLIVTGVLIFLLCLKRRRKSRERSQAGTVTQRDESSGAAAPYGSGPYTVQAVSIKQTAVAHDSESGGFYAFVRSVNVYRVFKN